MESNPETRFSLIEKIKNPEDLDAWMEFTAIYQPLIFNICRKKGLQHADATDVTQEVLIRVSKAIERYHHDRATSTFRGWLYRITRNLTVDYFRRQGNDPLAKAAMPDEIENCPEPTADEASTFHVEFRRQMFAVVARTVKMQVRPETWNAFWQTEVEHVDIDTVAKSLSMTTGAIYVARSRVLARLRKEVQRRMNETGTSLNLDTNGETR